MPPASNASTGSSRPPDIPRASAPADLYDPFAAESYDYDPFESDPPPAATPHILPPLPSTAPGSLPQLPITQAAPSAAATVATPDAQPKVGQATDAHTPGLGSLANASMLSGRSSNGGNGLPLPPASAAASIPLPPLAGQPPSSSRKHKSRWEDAGPAVTAEPVAGAAAQPPSAAAAAAAAEPIETRAKPRRSRFTDAPPAQAVPSVSGQGITQQAPAAATASMQPDPPLPIPPAVEEILPPKPASARQDGEAQAAAALEAVEQMLQAKRHSDARNIAPSTSRPRQPPPPPHQPPLPRPPPPQPPLPQLPPPQPAFTEGPGTGPEASWHTGHARPPFQTRPPEGFPGQPGAFPHMPPMLQQGLQRGMQRPPMGHLAPQHFVHAGLQQHHRPAPPHHLPSMLQHQPAPPQHDIPHASAPPPQQYPPPLRPQWQSKSPMDRQQSFEQPPPRPSRPSAPALSRRESTEADLGHFQTTSVAMDTPTDTVSDSSWRLRRPQAYASGSGGVPGPPSDRVADPTAPARDANAVPGPPAEGDHIPTPPPPPPPPADGPHATPLSAAAVLAPPRPPPALIESPPEASGSLARAAAVPVTDLAGDAGLIGESRSATPALDTTAVAVGATDGPGQLPLQLNGALTAEPVDVAHAAAPAGPAEDGAGQAEGTQSSSCLSFSVNAV